MAKIMLYHCGYLDDLVTRQPLKTSTAELVREMDIGFRGRNCRECPFVSSVLPEVLFTPPHNPAPIDNVTLACIDCVNPSLAADALRISACLPWRRVVLFSHERPDNIDDIEFVRIDKLTHRDRYNYFTLRDLHTYIDTAHVLTIQQDGFVMRPDLWDSSWLTYDYIGAPWPRSAKLPFADKTSVGNSGFCLRSKRFLEATAEIATDDAIQRHRETSWNRVFDDVFACSSQYDALAKRGMRWATEDVASRFAYERRSEHHGDWYDSFGFHGRHTKETLNLCQALKTRSITIKQAPQPPRLHAESTTMISPAQHKIIQIELTNACPKNCSNCTRFVSHVRKPFMLERPTFEKAVDSLAEFPGIVGIMGGEPTIHPEFDSFIRYYREVIANGRIHQNARQPIQNFAEYRNWWLARLHGSKRGLWTSLGPGYYRHFELIQETFDYQCINTHENPGLHQALLIARKDLGIPDDEWIEMRDRCWVQRMWSSSINQYGAYFCEVAAAIDSLFYGGASAWPVEPDWWKRQPEDFADQLHLCEHCSAPLNVPRRRSDEEIDDVSQTNAKLLESMGAPSVRADRLRVLETCDTDHDHGTPHAEWYLPETAPQKADNTARISPNNRSIHPKRLDGVVVCVGYGHYLAQTIKHNVAQFDQLVVATSPDDEATQSAALKAGAQLVLCDPIARPGDSLNKGVMLNAALAAIQPRDWVVFFDADILLPPTLRDWVLGNVLNPGCLYYTSRYHARVKWLLDLVKDDWRSIHRLKMRAAGDDQQPWGYFQLWNVRAQAIRDRWPAPVGEMFPTAGSVDTQWMRFWPEDKRICIDDESRQRAVVHIDHGDFTGNWHAGADQVGKTKWRFCAQAFAELSVQIVHRPEPPCWIKLSNVDSGDQIVFRWDGSPEFRLDDTTARYVDSGFDSFGSLWKGQPAGDCRFDVYCCEELPCDSST